MKDFKRIAVMLIVIICSFDCVAQFTPRVGVPLNRQDSVQIAQLNVTKTEVDSLTKKVDSMLDKLQKKKTFIFGLSAGVRMGLRYGPDETAKDRFLLEPSISPIDTTLKLDKGKKTDFLISAVMIAYPFKEEIFIKEKERKLTWYKKRGPTNRKVIASHTRKCRARNIGFVANISLVDLAGSDKFSTIFNKKTEGGIGLAWKCNEDFSLALTYEYVNRRTLKDEFFEKEGEKIIVGGKAITELKSEDSKYFKDDYYDAISFKLVYTF